MKLLLALPVGRRLRGGDPRGLVDIAQRAEQAGVAGVILAEHVVMGPHTEAYEWGPFPFPPESPWLEPIVVLSAMAAATERIVLSTGILIAALRPAPLLAKQVATLDLLSGGRVELGVGTGWQREELEAHGVPYERRGPALTDTIAACRALWGEQPATFASPTVRFGPIWCESRPLRTGGPPVLFSGTLTARNRRRIVELGDGWIPIMGATQDDITAGVAVLRAAYGAAGRDPSTLRVRAPLPLQKEGERPSLGRTLAGVAALEAIGATEVSIPLAAFARDEADLDEVFAELAELTAR